MGLLGTSNYCGAEARYWNICEDVSKELYLKGVAEWFCRQSDYVLALGKKFMMHQTLHIKEGDQHCFNF
jgi:hypothetical protein